MALSGWRRKTATIIVSRRIGYCCWHPATENDVNWRYLWSSSLYWKSVAQVKEVRQ
jgi:hypothetical protein